MPTMLDYERLVRENAYLRVELEKHTIHRVFRSDHNNRETAHEKRWLAIEQAIVTETEAEIRRLQRIIKSWEERYDILADLYMNQKHYAPLTGDWWVRKLYEKTIAAYKFWRDFTARKWNGK